MKSSKSDIRSIYQRIKGRGGYLGAAAMMMVLFLGTALFSQSGDTGNPDPSSLTGVVTVEIPSASGVVRVTLPDDVRAGDTISGTVVFTGGGAVEGEVVEVKTVEGEVVAVKSSDPGNKILKFIVPAGTSAIPFLLKNASGKHIGTAVLNVDDKFSGNIPTQLGSSPDKFSGNIPTQLGSITKPGTFTSADFNFAPPRLGQTGRSISIPGSFDGNAGNTGVNISGRDLPVIAESPRKSVVQIPADVPTGPGRLTVREGQGNPQTSKFNVVSVELKADKLNLMRGENTSLHISINGLRGLTAVDDARLHVRNMSPQTVDLSFSREYVRSENASGTRTVGGGKAGINDAGSVTYTERLQGISPGSFTINALLFAPPPRKDKDKNKEKEETIDPNSLRGRLKKIAELERAAANAVTGNSDAKGDIEDKAKEFEGAVKDKSNWNDKGGTKHLGELLRRLKAHKKELEEKQTQVGEGTAADKMGEAITAIDEAITAVEAEIEAEKKKKK